MTLFDALDDYQTETAIPPVSTPSEIPASPPKGSQQPQITPAELERAEKLGSKTFFLRVSFGLFGNSKKIPRGEVQVDADAESISSNKRLLDSLELKAIRDADAELMAALDLLCLPGFDKGYKFLPYAAFDKVHELLKGHRARRPRLVEKFLAAYPRLCEEAPNRLRAVYDPKDYPSTEEVRERFTFTYRYIQMDTPGKLAGLSQQAFEEERDKAARTLTSAADEIDRFMLSTFAAMVERLKVSLTDGPDGKKKKLFDTAVTGLRDFMGTWDMRNVNNYAELEAQINRARAVMAGIPDVDALREVESLRAKVRGGMEEVSQQLQAMVTAKPIRKFRADLED